MFRTLLFKPPPSEQISAFVLRNMRWFFFDGVTAAVSMAILNTFYTLYLESLGATNAQIGLLASLSSFSSLVMLLPGAWLAEKTGSRKGMVLLGSGGLNRLLLFVTIFLPFLFGGEVLILAAVAIKALMDGFANFSIPAWTSLSADLVPLEKRGRFFAARNLAMSVSTMATTFLAGYLIAGFGKPVGYQVALGVAFIWGVTASFCYSRLQEPGREGGAHASPPNRGNYSPAAIWQTLRADSNFRAYCIFTLLWSGSINIAAPFFPIYLVRELKATPDVVGVLSTILQIAALPATHLFGRLVDRWGGRRTQLLTGFLIPLLPILWMLPRAPWGLAGVYIYDGIVWSGYGLASFNFMLTLAPPGQLTRYTAFQQMVMATAVTLGSALGGLLVEELGYLPVFAISGAGRLVAMLFYWRFVRQPSPVPQAAG